MKTSKEEIQKRLSFFRRMFDEQRKVKYDIEYKTGYWRFYYNIVTDMGGGVVRKLNTHVEIRKLDNPDAEFKELVNRFKKILWKNDGIEWYCYTYISKSQLSTT